MTEKKPEKFFVLLKLMFKTDKIRALFEYEEFTFKVKRDTQNVCLYLS